MILLSASKVWLWVQRDGGKWSFLTWTKSHRHPDMSLEVVEVETLLILRENLFDLILELGAPVKVDVLSSWSPPTNFIRPSATGKMNFSFCWETVLPLHWIFLNGFPMRPSFPTPQCLQPLCHPSKFSPRTERIQGTIQARLSFQIDGFLTGPSQK